MTSRRHLEPMMGRLLACRSDAAALAETTENLWIEIGACLSPVLGAVGVRELYRRAVFLGSREHAELAVVLDGPSECGDYAALREVLSTLAPTLACSVSTVLLQNLHDLLVRLIGEALAARLLCPIEGPSGDSATRDTQR